MFQDDFCIIDGKPCEQDSIYCSEECRQKDHIASPLLTPEIPNEMLYEYKWEEPFSLSQVPRSSLESVPKSLTEEHSVTRDNYKIWLSTSVDKH